MKNLIFACVLLLGVGMVGCGGLGSSSSTSQCSGAEICGTGCMPIGASCCPSGQGFCISGQVCDASNLCISNTNGGFNSGITTCGNCPGNLQCQQVSNCEQFCTCFYTINGSDGSSAWYLVNGACYMCDQNGLSPSCNNAQQQAANAAGGCF